MSIRNDEQDAIGKTSIKIMTAERIFALQRTHAGDCDELTQISVALPIARDEDDMIAFREMKLAANQEFKSGRLGCYMGTNNAGECAFIRDGERCVAQSKSLVDELLRLGCAAQKAEARNAVEFCKTVT